MVKLRVSLVLATLFVFSLFVGCRSRQKPPAPAPIDRALEALEPLATDTGTLRIGAAERFDNLAIYPVFASAQHDIGPVLSLQAALAEGLAEVRELGNQAEPSHHQESGAAVNKLVIENKGKLPIYVLAGSVVKGGKQDRQIGQDFVVGPKSMVPIDAFCVEQGRWNANRDGIATQGKFRAVDQLASSSVRAAGQYESNQSSVWSEVAKVNAANKKASASGSLLASLDDAELAKQREALRTRIASKLAALEPSGAVVGFGYAVNGRVKGVRWFSSHALFKTFRDVLTSTAAADALSAPTADRASKPPAPKAVVSFVSEVESAAKEERSTPAENVNDYKRSKAGYGATTKFKPGSSKPTVPLSKDYVAK